MSFRTYFKTFGNFCLFCMPIYALFAVRNDDGKVAKEAFMLDDFGFFTRMTLKNLLRALAMDFSKGVKKGNEAYMEIVEKMDKEEIVISTQQDSKKRIVVVTDKKYNAAIRYKVTTLAMDIRQDYDKMVTKYKNWEEHDLTSQIESELKNANQNVIQGLASVLERGQTLNELVEKSENLSAQTKKLYKTAKKQNACC